MTKLVTVYLKGPWAPGGKDWDKGIRQISNPGRIVLCDNEYGLNRREYPMENVTRIQNADHW